MYIRNSPGRLGLGRVRSLTFLVSLLSNKSFLVSLSSCLVIMGGVGGRNACAEGYLFLPWPSLDPGPDRVVAQKGHQRHPEGAPRAKKNAALFSSMFFDCFWIQNGAKMSRFWCEKLTKTTPSPKKSTTLVLSALPIEFKVFPGSREPKIAQKVFKNAYEIIVFFTWILAAILSSLGG